MRDGLVELAPSDRLHSAAVAQRFHLFANEAQRIGDSGEPPVIRD